MASPAAILNILVTANSSQASASLLKTQGQLTATGATATKTGAVMKRAFLGIGLAAAGAGVALFEIGKEFDDTYDTIRTTTGKTGKELEGLKEDFRAVVKSVPADFDTAGKAIARVHQRLELTGHPLRRLTKQFTELSRITDTDLEANIQSVTRAFGDWDVNAIDEAPDFLDELFRASQMSGAAVDDLAQSVVQFGAPLRQLGFNFQDAVAMFAAFEEAGVNTTTMMPGLKFALRSFMEAGKDPQMALQKTFEGIADGTLKAQKAFEIFGGRATPDMIEAIRQGRFELDDFTKAMANGKDTIRKAGKDTMDFGEQWTLFKNNVLLALEPVATRVFGAVSDAMKELTDIMSDPKLSNDEKWDKMGAVLSDKVAAWAPKIAEAAGKVGIALAKGLFRAFIDAPLLGKLFMGGLLIRALGGAGVFGKIGVFIGKKIAERMALTMGAATVAEQVASNIMGGGAAGKWKGLGGRLGGMLGKFIGPAAGIAAAAGIALLLWQNREAIFNTAKDIAKEIGEILGFGGPSFAEASEKGYAFVETFKNIQGELTKTQAKGLRARAKDLRASGELTKNTYHQLLEVIRDKTGDAEKSSTRNLKKAADRGDKASKKLKTSVADNVADLANAVAGGMKNIRDNTNKSLQAFGVKKLSFSIASVGQAVGNAVGRQQGGIVVPGTGSGDKVPLHVGGRLAAMVESGELVSVANRTATADLMRHNSRVPRRADGGVVPHLAGGGIVSAPGFPGERINSKVLGAFQSLIQRFNLFLTDAYGPGHASPEHTQYGTAIDVVPGAGGSWADVGRAVAYSTRAGYNPVYYDGSGGSINLPPHGPGHHAHITLLTVAELLAGKSPGAGGGAIAEMVKRVLLKGPAGPLLDMGQSALDKSRKAANAYITKHMPMEGAEAGSMMTGSGEVEKVFARVAKRISTSKIATLALGMAGYAESGMQDLAYGDSSSQGPLQLLASTAAGLGVSPHDEAAIASLFFQRGFFGRGGANALAASGLPAHLVAQNVQGSAFSSGSNYAAQRGPATAWMRRYGLKHGGLVSMLQEGGIVDTIHRNREYRRMDPKELYEQSRRYMDKLRAAGLRVESTDERIDIAQRLAGLESSPDGSELSSAERLKQLSLHKLLGEQLTKMGGFALEGMQVAEFGLKDESKYEQRFKDMKVQFRDALAEIQGRTGGGGRLFDTALGIEDLQSLAISPGVLGAQGLLKSLELIQAEVAGIDEMLGIAETLGLDQTPGLQSLLAALQRETGIGRAGLALVNEGLVGASGESLSALQDLGETFQSDLAEMIGVTGQGGRIFDTQQALEAGRASVGVQSILDALTTAQTDVSLLDENISLAERLSSFASSPAGSELSPDERAGLVALQQSLLTTLEREAGVDRGGLKAVETLIGAGGPKSVLDEFASTFRDDLADMVGLSGKGGRIFDTTLAIKELGFIPQEDSGDTADAGRGPMTLSDLLSFAEAARYGVLDKLIPRFHEGGIFRAQRPGGEGLAMLRDREVVTPPGRAAAAPVLYADIYIGGEKINERVEVKLRERERADAAHYRAGAVR